MSHGLSVDAELLVKKSMTVVAYCENSVQYVPPDDFFGIQIAQIQFWPGPALDPTGGAYDTPPDLLVDCGGDPLPIPCLLDAFGVSLSTSPVSNLGAFDT